MTGTETLLQSMRINTMQTKMRGLFNKVVYHYTPTPPDTKRDERIAITPPSYLSGVVIVVLFLMAITSDDTAPAQQIEPGVFAHVKWADVAWLVCGSIGAFLLGLILMIWGLSRWIQKAEKKASEETEKQSFQAVLKHSPEPVRELVIKMLAQGKNVTLDELRAFTITYERLQKEEYAKKLK